MRSRPGGNLLLLLLVAVGHLIGARAALADPDYGPGPILYGLDPVVHGTSDPRLLGVDRLVLRRRLDLLGVDPLRHPERRPGLRTSFYKYMTEKSQVDLVRTQKLVEFNGPLGLMTEFQYPSFFFLFPTEQPLPGGFSYYPPRPVTDPVVKLFVDDLQTGAARRQAVDRVLVRQTGLDVAGSGQTGKKGEGLINLTIPIKLPRTLEKIIGRGEKTKIKITGRERIAITGESKVIKPFVPNERVTSQSLFPTLDMEQELQINLTGTIGEKIIIAVDHNSAQIGPDATKIKLSYQGTEDEVIKTIETGDVGLTLPGSQLLGYNSNKSGLFGIKVTGQVGRADFTVVASKQKAESSSKSFNAQGGQVSDNVILSSDYLNNRFFRLDLPSLEPQGRRTGEKIELSSIYIYRLLGPGTPGAGEITNVAVYVDSTGFRDWDTGIDFNNPWDYGLRWRQVEDFDPLLNAAGGLEAIDMRTSLSDADVLACVYTVVDASGTPVGRVGDVPGQNDPTQTISGEGTTPFYRMKILKASINKQQDHVYGYVLRNIYSLGGSNIDPTTFDLRIEATDTSLDHPENDEHDIPYVRIFGLDVEDPSRNPGADGIVDVHNPLIFDLNRGLLKFPLDFPHPFWDETGTGDRYRANTGNDPAFAYSDSTFLFRNQASEFLYNPRARPSDFKQEAFFKIVATHASASSSFNLNASNIEEGSEVVTIDGRTLVNGVDYEIDYTFGELQLKGEAANLTPDSKISVTYSFSPFFGGGNTSLMGLNLGYDLGHGGKAATTLLYETSAIVGEKAKLGEEPSKNLVGNFNLQHTLKPGFLTDIANLLSRRDTERESTLQLNGEIAVSLPNPNTKGQVYLEDFEGVDASDIISLNRIGWSWASQPFLSDTSGDPRVFSPESRVDNVRWFLPKERTLRRYLNPELINQERDETQPSMDLYLRQDATAWGPENWGGIMRGISRTGLDLSKSQFVEVWINDGQPDRVLRTGKVHIDFGYINEDGFWPENSGVLETGTYQKEDANSDGVWTFDEDIGLDGNENGPQKFDATYDLNGDAPYPRINGTARNNREDSEDLNGNDRLDRDDGYFTTTIDLAATEPLVDVDYDYDDVQDLKDDGIAWRKYRIPIGAVEQASTGITPDIKAITHVRIWFEDDSMQAQDEVHLQFSELRFLGSRWEREGVRRIAGEKLLSAGERLPGEEFFLGEVNNKENPDYNPPFKVEEINNIPTKEQSLVMTFQNLEQGHLARASKQVSAQGEDYTTYRDISWYWNNPSHNTADLDLFFRVGSDTLNYYEVNYRYADSARKTGWHQMALNISELSAAKSGTPNADGVVESTIRDLRSGDTYRVRVVGRPDMRRVRRYFFGVANRVLSDPATGFIYLNDVKLEGVKRDMGLAERAGVRLNMADVIKADFDWRRTDAEFHGLDRTTGAGAISEDWSANTSINIDDFLPLAGFKLPVNLGRQRKTQQPKYLFNSDIEIMDEEIRRQESSLETSERFSSRLSHTPSKSAVARYLVDPWVLQMNGSRSRKHSPINRSQTKNLAGSINYDLRINGDYQLGDYPVFEYVPLLKGLSIVPQKVAFGGRFTSSFAENVNIAADGLETVRPATKTRPVKLEVSVDYRPLKIMDMSVSGNSERDMLRERRLFGVNIGQENRRNYNLRLTFLVPKSKLLPRSAIYSPLRVALRVANKMRPSIQFNGSFGDVHDPGIRQPDDPIGIRSVSNSGKWDFRMDVPIGSVFKSLFPENKYSQSERDQMVARQAAQEQQDARRAGRGGPARKPATGGGDGTTPVKPGGDGTTPVKPRGDGTTPADNADLTPEQRQKLEYERLLKEADEKREQEKAAGLIAEPPAAPGHRVNPLTVFNPVLNLLRNTTPVKITYTASKGSSYTRLLSTADFWYKTGLVSDLDAPEDEYAAFSADDRKGLTLSSTSKVSRALGLDVKYARSNSLRDQIGSVIESYKQEWPDAQISLSNVEKWRIFGGDPNDRDAGWFSSSNMSFAFKRTKTVNGFTASSYNPKYLTTITPRWTMNFRGGMTATLNATLTRDHSLASGVTTNVNRNRLGFTLRKQFRADSFLAKLGLYRPGASQVISMDVDMSYEQSRTERLNPTGATTAPTGNTRYNVNPRFSVQVSRNLNAAVRFIFGRTKALATNQTTTTLGLGLEATFVF